MATPLFTDPSQMQQRDVRSRRPTQAMPQAPGLTGSDEGYTRQVQDNELSQTHLNNMLDEGGRYITSARGRGSRFAASRGMANSSLAAAAAEGSAIDAAAPFALSDADAYRAAAGQNLDSLASQRMADEQNSTTRYTSDNSVGAQLRIAARESEDRERENALDRSWRTSERDAEQRWRSEESGRDRDFTARENERGARRTMRAGVGAGIMSTILNNPEYFRDPQAAAGAIDFYLGEWDRLYPPEVEGGG